MRSPDVTASIYATTMQTQIQRILDDNQIRDKACAIRAIVFEMIGTAIRHHESNNIRIRPDKITIVNRGRKKCET